MFEKLQKKKSPPKEGSSQIETNTNTDESRLKRAENQYRFEQDVLHQTFNRPFTERFLLTRSAIFKDFTDVSGEDIHRLMSEGQIMSNRRAQINDEFIPSNHAAEAALQHIIPSIDRWYEEISKIEDESERVAVTLRMVTVLFVCGIMIHPVRDGNGQTFKALVLSYLHDLLPSLRSKFIPIKYSTDTTTPDTEMGIKFMGGGLIAQENDLTAGAVPKIEADTGVVKHLLECLESARTIYHKIDDGPTTLETLAEKDLQIKNLAKRLSIELKRPELAEQFIQGYEERKFGFIKRKRPVYASAFHSLLHAVERYLLELGHDPERAYATVYQSRGQKIHRASYAIRQLMATEEGMNVLNTYVLQGELTPPTSNKLNVELYDKALRTFDQQMTHMIEILEDEQAHKDRHTAMMSKLKS